MRFDRDQVSTFTFDSYSTLVDVDAAEKALAERVDDAQPVSKLWRARSLESTFVANAIDAYQPFYEMNRDALQYALDVFGVDLSTSERDEILAVYHELDVFDDVRDGIEQLRDGGYDCYVASNGIRGHRLPQTVWRSRCVGGGERTFVTQKQSARVSQFARGDRIHREL